MVALGFLAQAAFGTGTLVDGLACTPTAPASMTVNVGPGSIIALSTVDATAYGSLAADSTDALVKIGINLASTPFTLTAPTTSGQSINYLIEASFQEADGGPTVLPYYNAANPATPYTGPNNSGTAQNTTRTQRVALQLKAGAPANTGTQTTPATDAGWTALYVVTVNYGQTTITNSSISTVAGAPFIPAKLGPGMVPGFANAAVFNVSGTWVCPAGITKVRARVWGGGGSGGGSLGAGSAASGAAAGGFSEGIYPVVPGTSYPITVGSGGVPVAGANNGNPGGTSSFASFCSATGGGAGFGANATVQGTVPGSSSATGGTIINLGGNGGGTGLLLGSNGFGGNGGATFGSSIAQSTGSGTFPGGGGAGGCNGSNSGAGASGIVILEY